MLKIINTAQDSKVREMKALVNGYPCLLEPPIFGPISYDGRCERNIARFARSEGCLQLANEMASKTGISKRYFYTSRSSATHFSGTQLNDMSKFSALNRRYLRISKNTTLEVRIYLHPDLVPIFTDDLLTVTSNAPPKH